MARTIVRDDWKRERNLKAHHLDFDELTEEFFLSATVLPAKQGRLMAIGEFRKHIIAVVFKPLGFGRHLNNLHAPSQPEGKETPWEAVIDAFGP